MEKGCLSSLTPLIRRERGGTGPGKGEKVFLLRATRNHPSQGRKGDISFPEKEEATISIDREEEKKMAARQEKELS